MRAEAGVALSADRNARIEAQRGRIDDPFGRAAFGNVRQMIRSGTMTRLATDPALFAGAESAGFTVARQTSLFEIGSEHKAQHGFKRMGFCRCQSRRKKKVISLEAPEIAGLNQSRPFEWNAGEFADPHEEAKPMPLPTHDDLDRQREFSLARQIDRVEHAPRPSMNPVGDGRGRPLHRPGIVIERQCRSRRAAPRSGHSRLGLIGGNAFMAAGAHTRSNIMRRCSQRSHVCGNE